MPRWRSATPGPKIADAGTDSIYQVSNKNIEKAMEKIIQKSIEGGWTNFKPNFLLGEADFIDGVMKRNQFVLDPLFWQALGKACGWGISCYHYASKFGWEAYRHQAKCEIGAYSWEANALRFHEINLTEGWDAAVAYLAEITK